MIQFTVPGNPVGKGRPRLSKWGVYTPKETVQYEKLVLLSYLGSQCRAYMDSKEPLQMSLQIYMSIPKSATKKQHQDAMSGVLKPVKRPDIDNIAKCIMDALNGNAYHDDNQIIEIHCCKAYSDEPRVCVNISLA